MINRKITLFFSFFISLVICAQQYNFDKELVKIDSIVNLIDNNEKQYIESVMEGSIVFSGVFTKKGGWDSYYLYDKNKKDIPIRVCYNQALKKTYESYVFYYLKGKVVFIKLNVKFYKRSNNSFQRKYYFKDSKLIFDSNPTIENYNLAKVLNYEEMNRDFFK